MLDMIQCPADGLYYDWYSLPPDDENPPGIDSADQIKTLTSVCHEIRLIR